MAMTKTASHFQVEKRQIELPASLSFFVAKAVSLILASIALLLHLLSFDCQVLAAGISGTFRRPSRQIRQSFVV
jgi:hypothetical protein